MWSWTQLQSLYSECQDQIFFYAEDIHSSKRNVELCDILCGSQGTRHYVKKKFFADLIFFLTANRLPMYNATLEWVVFYILYLDLFFKNCFVHSFIADPVCLFYFVHHCWLDFFILHYLLEWGCLYFWSMLWCKNCIFEMSCGSAFNLYWSNQWSLFLFLLLMLHTYLNMLLLQLFNFRHCF